MTTPELIAFAAGFGACLLCVLAWIWLSADEGCDGHPD